MEQYLKALRGREDISEEVLLELEERFKVVEEIIDAPVEPTGIELLQQENGELKARLYKTESIMAETSSTQQDLVELLIDLGVI